MYPFAMLEEVVSAMREMTELIVEDEAWWKKRDVAIAMQMVTTASHKTMQEEL